jgi:hypothetical protein
MESWRYSSTHPTEHADVSVTLEIHIEVVLRSNFSLFTDNPDDARDLPQSLQANAEIVPPRDHDSFLPNPFQFIHGVIKSELLTRS